MVEAPKRGRKKKEEYYKNKQADNVSFERVFTIINIPISVEDILGQKSFKREEEIMLENPQSISGYQKENFYSEALTSSKPGIESKIEIISKTKPDSQEYSLGEIESIYNLNTIPSEININDTFTTNIKCWWCCHSFESSPVFMPTYFDGDMYKVKGIFCSFECCYAYMIDSFSYKKNRYMLCSMFKTITNSKGGLDDNIRRAPPRETLRIFGGVLDIEEFRKPNCIVSFNKCPQTYIKDQVKVTRSVSKDEIKSILPSSKKSIKHKLPANNLSKIIGIKAK